MVTLAQSSSTYTIPTGVQGVGVGVVSAAKFAVTVMSAVTFVSVRGFAVEASLQSTK